MMVIDMTAQLSSLMIGLNVLMVVAGAAVLASARKSRSVFSASQPVTASKVAVVGSSSSAPAPAEDAPGDTSVPEAA